MERGIKKGSEAKGREEGGGKGCGRGKEGLRIQRSDLFLRTRYGFQITAESEKSGRGEDILSSKNRERTR